MKNIENLNQTTNLINLLNTINETPKLDELDFIGINIQAFFAVKVIAILFKDNGKSITRKKQGK